MMNKSKRTITLEKYDSPNFTKNERYKLQYLISTVNNWLVHDGRIKDLMENALTYRQYEILRKRCDMNMTLEEIGREHNLSRERVGQIEKQAVEKLIDFFVKGD